MPRCTLSFENGRPWTDSGGCFGFTGRSSSVRGRGGRDNDTITNYQFDLSHCWNGAPLTFNGMCSSPKDLWNMLASNSPWSKYVHRVNNLDRDNNWSVDIKTDIPGHAVIGTASVFRFMKYMERNSGLGLSIYNLAVKAKAHPMIAFLVASLAYGLISPLIHGDRRDYGRPQERLELGDDIPFQLNAIDINDLYALIDGTWEFKDNDGSPTNLYRDTGLYSQNILSSYTTGDFNFFSYVLSRFFPIIPTVTKERVRSGMGSSSANSHAHLGSNTRTMEPMSLIGVALQLSSEYRRHGNFAGITRFGGTSNGV